MKSGRKWFRRHRLGADADSCKANASAVFKACPKPSMMPPIGEVIMKTHLLLAGLSLFLCSRAAMAQTAAEREACQADYQKYCAGVQPGGGRIMQCLAQHLGQLTPQCKSVVEANLPK